MKNVKETKGITLIALVITIIVLLILAGVAISMLSGENGILTRASEAKEKTEEAQKEEETGLASMELETYFLTNNLKYKCAYGYVTGIEIGETVEQLQTALNDGGYELKAIDGTNNFTEKNSEEKYIVTTDMQIQKNGKKLANTVIYGDVCSRGYIDVNDSSAIYNFLGGGTPIQNKIAADANHDGIVDYKDADLLKEVAISINQNVYAINPNNLILKDVNSLKNNYIKLLREKYTVEYTTWTYNDKEISKDAITDTTETTTVKDILDLLPEEAAIYRPGTKTFFKRDNGTELVQTMDRIVVIDKESISDGNVEYEKRELGIYIVKK